MAGRNFLWGTRNFDFIGLADIFSQSSLSRSTHNRNPVKLFRAGAATKRGDRYDEAIFQGIRNLPETKMRSYHPRRIVVMERDMNTAVARLLEQSSKRTISSFDSLVSVAVFSGVGLLISLSVLLLDRYIPGEWF